MTRFAFAAALTLSVVASWAAAPPAGAQTVGACPQAQVTQYIAELTAMSTASETSIRYLVPKFRECGQGAIAGELAGSPEWLASMRQHIQAQATSAPELKVAIDTAIGNLGKAESSLQKHYTLVLQGIDSMYDNRFPPACRREREKIVGNMKSTRPQVPAAIDKLHKFKACLG
jgi:hypothetical protein